MKFLKKNWTTILLILIFIVGIGMLAYPTIANWWNTTMASHIVAGYEDSVRALDSSEYNQLLEAARQYNEALASNPARFTPTDEQKEEYEKQLSVDGLPVMGTVLIPSVKISLPIYHGTSEEVLAVGAGHLEGSSLPVGGAGTHTVITGHRGLPSAMLFTDLDKVSEGDYVILKILNETLTYEIDRINIVLPQDVDKLTIEPQEDLLTLVTCTPYGVNTHRMLLMGHRVENLAGDYEGAAEAKQIDEKFVAIGLALLILILLFIGLMIRSRKPKSINS